MNGNIRRQKLLFQFYFQVLPSWYILAEDSRTVLLLHILDLGQKRLLAGGNLGLASLQTLLLGVPAFLDNLARSLLRVGGIGANGGVGLLIHFLHGVGCDAKLDVPGELSLVGLLVLLHEVLHVVGHVLAEDVVAVGTSVQLLLLVVISGEPLVRVGDVETAISGALHSTENLGPGRGPGQTNVKATAECSRTIIGVLNTEEFTVDVLVALVRPS